MFFCRLCRIENIDTFILTASWVFPLCYRDFDFPREVVTNILSSRGRNIVDGNMLNQQTNIPKSYTIKSLNPRNFSK